MADLSLFSSVIMAELACPPTDATLAVTSARDAYRLALKRLAHRALLQTGASIEIERYLSHIGLGDEEPAQ